MLVDKIDPIQIINNLNTENFMDWGEDFSFDDLFKKPDLHNERYKAAFVKRYKPYKNNNIARELFGDRVTNVIVYPPYGGMSWHTNGPKKSKRMYMSWSEDGNSGMSWYDTEKDELIVDQDDQGWNVRFFDIPTWHCVWSKCYRLAIGYNVMREV